MLYIHICTSIALTPNPSLKTFPFTFNNIIEMSKTRTPMLFLQFHQAAGQGLRLLMHTLYTVVNGYTCAYMCMLPDSKRFIKRVNVSILFSKNNYAKADVNLERGNTALPKGKKWEEDICMYVFVHSCLCISMCVCTQAYS